MGRRNYFRRTPATPWTRTPCTNMPPRRFRRVRRRRGLRFGRRRVRRGRYGMRRMRRLVRSVIRRQEETKILPVLGTSINMGGTQTYVFNPQFQVAQGVGSGARVGRKISNAFMRLSFRYSHRGENAVTTNIADKSVLRMLVLRSRAIKTATVASNNLQVDPSGATSGDIFYQGGHPHTFSQVDKNRWTVVMDRVYSSIRNIDSSDNITNFVQRRNLFIPLPRNVTYRDDQPTANSVSTGSETYIVFVAGFRNAQSLDFVGTLETQGTIRWKDA